MDLTVFAFAPDTESSDIATSLRAHIEGYKRIGANPGSWMIQRYILAKGQSFRARPLPIKYPAMIPKACFQNARRLAGRYRSLRYVEGFATTNHMPGWPIHHGWCIDRTGGVVDPTWTDGSAYYGVIFSKVMIARADAFKPYGAKSTCLLDTPRGVNAEWMFADCPDLRTEVLTLCPDLKLPPRKEFIL
jgi:hypothetical protein